VGGRPANSVAANLLDRPLTRPLPTTRVARGRRGAQRRNTLTPSNSLPSRRQFLPPPAKRWGGLGWGAPPQIRCQWSSGDYPPPPTPPHHAQERVGGGELTVHTFAISRRDAPELCQDSLTLQPEGAGNAGRPMRPIAACAKVVVVSTRVSQVTPEIARHSPRNGLRLIARSPRRPAFLPPSSADHSANLMPASGHQDHTTSPSASGALVFGAIRVHRIPPHVRDDRETPLIWAG